MVIVKVNDSFLGLIPIYATINSFASIRADWSGFSQIFDESIEAIEPISEKYYHSVDFLSSLLES